LSQSLQSSRINTHTSLTDKIQNALNDQIASVFATYGWQIENTSAENALILNIPTTAAGVFEQYVMNTLSGAWTRFQGWNASCWEQWKEREFFGGPTYVAKAFDTNADNAVAINTDLKTSFNYFNSRGQLKQWSMVRPIFSTSGSPAVIYGLNVDFEDTLPTGVPTFNPFTAALWDSSVWDGASWGGENAVQKSWQFLSGLGYCAALRMKTQSGTGVSLRLSSVDYVFKVGGVL